HDEFPGGVLLLGIRADADVPTRHRCWRRLLAVPRRDIGESYLALDHGRSLRALVTVQALDDHGVFARHESLQAFVIGEIDDVRRHDLVHLHEIHEPLHGLYASGTVEHGLAIGAHHTAALRPDQRENGTVCEGLAARSAFGEAPLVDAPVAIHINGELFCGGNELVEGAWRLEIRLLEKILAVKERAAV